MASESPVTAEDLQKALTEVAAALTQFRSKYALIGGVATSYRSQPRFTKDVDFLLTVPQLVLPPLLEDLQGRGFEFDMTATIREWTQHHMVVLSYHGIRVDWLKAVLPAYVHVLDHAIEETWLDQPITIAAANSEPERQANAAVFLRSRLPPGWIAPAVLHGDYFHSI